MDNEFWSQAFRAFTVIGILILLFLKAWFLLFRLPVLMRTNKAVLEDNSKAVTLLTIQMVHLTEAWLEMARRYAESSLRTMQHTNQTLDDIRAVRNKPPSDSDSSGVSAPKQ